MLMTPMSCHLLAVFAFHSFARATLATLSLALAAEHALLVDRAKRGTGEEVLPMMIPLQTFGETRGAGDTTIT